VIPATAALLHANVELGVALAGLYVNNVPLQISAGVRVELRSGIGFTATVTLNVVGFVQPLALTVYTYVTVVLTELALFNVSLIDPMPLAGPVGVIPVTAARVHVKVAPPVRLVGV
jgi:hypothetical protein